MTLGGPVQVSGRRLRSYLSLNVVAAPPAWPFIETSPSGGLCWREERDKHFNRPREKLCETWIPLNCLFADAQPDESSRDESQTASKNEVVFFVNFYKM